MEAIFSRVPLLILLGLLPTLSVSISNGVGLHSVDVVWLPVAALAFFCAALRPEKLRLRIKLVDLLILGFLAAVTISTFLSFSPDISLEVFLDWVRVVAVYFLMRLLFGLQSVSEAFLTTIKIAAAILLIVGAVQVITGTQFGLVGNLVGQDREQQVDLRLHAEEVAMRVSGTTSNPNIYGLWVILFSGIWMTHLLWEKKYFGFLLLASLSALVLLRTFSRGALATYLIMLAGMCGFLIFRGRRHLMSVVWISLFVIIMVVFVLLWFAFENPLPETLELLSERFKANNDSVRMRMIEAGWDFLDSPKTWLVGLGPGVFHSYAYSKGYNLGPKPWEDYSSSTSGIHNVFFKLLVEYGFLTLLFALAFLVTLLARLRFVYLRGSAMGVVWSVYGLSVTGALLLIAAQVYESPLSYQVTLPCAMIVAFLVTARTTVEGANEVGERLRYQREAV